LPAELAAARKEGLPLHPDDLRPARPIPPQQNAAPIYAQIHRSLQIAPKSDRLDLPKLARSKSPADRKKAREVLARRSSLLALARKASARPFCDFNRAYEKGPDLLLPEYASMRELGRMLAADSLLKARDGDIEGAFASIKTAWRLSDHAGKDPILIAMLVSIAISAMADRAYQQVLLEHASDPRTIALAAESAHFPPSPSLENAFRGEVVMGRVCAEMTRNSPNAFASAARVVTRKGESIRADMSDAWEVRLIEYWRNGFRILRNTPNKHIEQAVALKSLGDEVEKLDGKPTYELAAILMPVFSQAAVKLAMADEQTRLRRTTLEIARFRSKTGRWPASLGELARPPQPDIFTGKPPIYRRTDKGFLLYSVGEDRRDDGGRTTKDEKTGALDLTVKFPRD
jgi:hypothetical protein